MYSSRRGWRGGIGDTTPPIKLSFVPDPAMPAPPEPTIVQQIESQPGAKESDSLSVLAASGLSPNFQSSYPPAAPDQSGSADPLQVKPTFSQVVRGATTTTTYTSTYSAAVPVAKFTQLVNAFDNAKTVPEVAGLWQRALDFSKGVSLSTSAADRPTLGVQIARVRDAKDAALKRVSSAPVFAKKTDKGSPGGGPLDTSQRDQLLLDLAMRSGQLPVQQQSSGVSAGTAAALVLGGLGLLLVVAIAVRPRS